MPAQTQCVICGLELDGETMCPVCRFRRPELASSEVDFATVPVLSSPPGLSDSQKSAFVAKHFLPRIWIGYVIAALVAILEFTEHTEPNASEFGPGASAAFLWGIFYWAYCVYKLHELPHHLLGSNYPISPNRGAGFNFIPLYNFLWFYRWTSVYANFLNSRTSRSLVSGSRLGFLLLVAFLLRLVDGAVSLFVFFAALGYLTNKIRQAGPLLWSNGMSRPAGGDLPLMETGVGASSAGQNWTRLAGFLYGGFHSVIFIVLVMEMLGVQQAARSPGKPLLANLVVIGLIPVFLLMPYRRIARWRGAAWVLCAFIAFIAYAIVVKVLMFRSLKRAPQFGELAVIVVFLYILLSNCAVLYVWTRQARGTPEGH